MKNRIYVATHNRHKLEEIGAILPGFELVADDPEAEENAPDFAGNALIKVRAIAARHPGEWCIADDSGLEVDALNGAPGVHSARYAGEQCDFGANNALLLKKLSGQTNRRANFNCTIALISPDGSEKVFAGKCFGRIAESPSGDAGFGYDPLFIPDGCDRSFAEMAPAEKNAISHRAIALARLSAYLRHQSDSRLYAWLRFFRIVNLPTVPGDVLAGMALALAGGAAVGVEVRTAIAASVASMALYLYGMADNDLVGAPTDRDRPLACGEISVGAATAARGICFLVALSTAALGNLPPVWWMAALLLFMSIIFYNRTKWPVLMGLCRALNLACGAAALLPAGCVPPLKPLIPAMAAAGVWWAYIAGVTVWSDHEHGDPVRRRRTGMLLGALVYLQLAALAAAGCLAPAAPGMRGMLLAGAVLLVVLRVFNRLSTKVSAT